MCTYKKNILLKIYNIYDLLVERDDKYIDKKNYDNKLSTCTNGTLDPTTKKSATRTSPTCISVLVVLYLFYCKKNGFHLNTVIFLFIKKISVMVTPGMNKLVVCL